ncbi:MAG: winged helix DNA-binding protein [Parvibaculum sp.]
MARKDAALQFLEFYYPIHYKAGVRVEDAMRGKEIGRHQVAILWLIHSEGEGGTQLSRKDIERHLDAWFEISGGAITKALRSMASPPLSLLTLSEAAHSGREKIVTLTKEGEKFVSAMIGRGNAFIKRIIETMSDEEISQGLHFFQRIAEIVDELD